MERKLSCSIDGRGMAGGNGCYGCAAACVEHCLTLLKALATKQLTRALLHNQGKESKDKLILFIQFSLLNLKNKSIFPLIHSVLTFFIILINITSDYLLSLI